MTRRRSALVLGIAGLAPFWGFAFAALIASAGQAQSGLVLAQLVWGAMILAFLSGARWSMVLAANGMSDLRMMMFGGIPAISLGAVFLPPVWGLPILIAAFGLLLAAELAPRARSEAPSWYPRLRTGLSAGAIAAMCVAWSVA